jgi:hypothetical protein
MLQRADAGPGSFESRTPRPQGMADRIDRVPMWKMRTWWKQRKNRKRSSQLENLVSKVLEPSSAPPGVKSATPEKLDTQLKQTDFNSEGPPLMAASAVANPAQPTVSTGQQHASPKTAMGDIFIFKAQERSEKEWRKVLFDSGSAVNFVSIKALEDLQHDIKTTESSKGDKVLSLSSWVRPKGIVWLRFKFRDEPTIYEEEFYVLPKKKLWFLRSVDVGPGFDCLLGWTWMAAHRNLWQKVVEDSTAWGHDVTNSAMTRGNTQLELRPTPLVDTISMADKRGQGRPTALTSDSSLSLSRR